MNAAVELSRQALGLSEPNPPVGALLVRDGWIIGRGHTQRCGGPHAEVMALRAAAEAGGDARGATLYVTLEPCSHHGRTPPCADAVIAAGVARVVVAVEDPYEQVRGRGLERLRSAGVEVSVGAAAAAAREVLAPYLKRVRTGRPWVICKWAQTLDGRLATRTGHSRWISSEASRERVHALRAICDGILVGVGTVLADDPLLTCRSAAEHDHRRGGLTRIVLDRRLDTPAASQLLNTPDQGPVLLAVDRTALQLEAELAARARKFQASGVEVLALGTDAFGRVDLAELLDELGRRQWTRLLVEGGGAVLGGFLSAGLVDELNIYLAPKFLGDPAGTGVSFQTISETMDASMRLPAPTVEPVGDDLLLRYVLSDPQFFV